LTTSINRPLIPSGDTGSPECTPRDDEPGVENLSGEKKRKGGCCKRGPKKFKEIKQNKYMQYSEFAKKGWKLRLCNIMKHLLIFTIIYTLCFYLLQYNEI